MNRYLQDQCFNIRRAQGASVLDPTVMENDAGVLAQGATEIVRLAEGHTYFRPRGVLHALRNASAHYLVVQSFQSPLPSDEATRWVRVEHWPRSGDGCPRCWCGQVEDDRCVNCGAALARYRRLAGGL